MNRSVILRNHFCSCSGFISSASSTAFANSSAVMVVRRAISSEAFGGIQNPHSMHNASRSRLSSLSLIGNPFFRTPIRFYPRRWNLEASIAALERLAQVTTNKGTAMPSPLQALVRRPARKEITRPSIPTMHRLSHSPALHEITMVAPTANSD